MKQTSNYNLNKPDANDMFSLEHWNENSDKIDEALTPEFEDYTGTTTAPDAATALSRIKSRTKIATLFQNIKAFCKGCCTIGMLVNNCVTDNANLPLAASQGKALMDQIASLNGRIFTYNNARVEAGANDNSTFLQVKKTVENVTQQSLYLSHHKNTNTYHFNYVYDGKYGTERQIITDGQIQLNLSLPEGDDVNNYNRFGFFSGQNLKNAPVAGWFQFMVFPLNNNSNYSIQFGFMSGTGTWHFYMRAKYQESWAGVSWKEFNVSFKE